MIASRRGLLAVGMLVMGVWSAAPPLQAATVNGIDVPDSIRHADSELTLNGTGQRTRFRIKLYLAALWIPAAERDAEAIVMSEEPMVLKLYFQSGLLNGKRMEKALREGFHAATGGDTSVIQAQIDTLSGLVRAEGIEPGDTMTLAYQPREQNTILSKNETELTRLPGQAFKQALLRIWLGDEPVQSRVKSGLLGG